MIPQSPLLSRTARPHRTCNRARRINKESREASESQEYQEDFDSLSYQTVHILDLIGAHATSGTCRACEGSLHRSRTEFCFDLPCAPETAANCISILPFALVALRPCSLLPSVDIRSVSSVLERAGRSILTVKSRRGVIDVIVRAENSAAERVVTASGLRRDCGMPSSLARRNLFSSGDEENQSSQHGSTELLSKKSTEGADVRRRRESRCSCLTTCWPEGGVKPRTPDRRVGRQGSRVRGAARH